MTAMKCLRIGYLSTIYHTAHLIRKLKWVESFLAAEVVWQLFGTGPSMLEAFQSGAINIGYIGLPPAMIGIGKGLPLKCIGGGHVEGTVLIAREMGAHAENSPDVLSALKQFEGKKIGSPSKGSIHDVIIRFLIKKHGLQQVGVTNYSWADLIPEAINEGEIDGAVGTPPLAVLAHRWYGHFIVISPARIWPFNPSYGIVVTEDMLAEKSLLEEFLSLHERACNLMIQKPLEAAKVIAAEVKVVDRPFIMEVLSVSPRYCASIPAEYVDATLAFVPALKEMGYLAHDLTKKDIFELSFIEKVHPEPHHYLSPLRV